MIIHTIYCKVEKETKTQFSRIYIKQLTDYDDKTTSDTQLRKKHDKNVKGWYIWFDDNKTIYKYSSRPSRLEYVSVEHM